MRPHYRAKADENYKKARRVMRVEPYSEKLKGEVYKNYALMTERGEKKIIPIMVRHMSARLWRHMFWLDVEKIVIDGQEYDGMCSMCMNAIPCLQKGRGSNHKFECRARKEVLIPLQRKEEASGSA